MTNMQTVIAGLALLLATQAQAADSSAAAPVQNTGLYGVKLAEPDLAKAVAFYELLGMKKGRLNQRSGSQEMVWPAPAIGSKLSLFQNPAPNSGIMAAGTFLVIQVSDTHAAAAALKAGGFTVLAEPHLSGPAIVAIVLDPGGNRIEIVSPKRDAQ